jgi:hypothetical protein
MLRYRTEMSDADAGAGDFSLDADTQLLYDSN